jgi:hypothetical protein
MGLFKIEGLFNRPNDLEDLRQRIRAEMEQISPTLLSAVYNGGQFQHLHKILLLTLDVGLFLFEVN